LAGSAIGAFLPNDWQIGKSQILEVVPAIHSISWFRPENGDQTGHSPVSNRRKIGKRAICPRFPGGWSAFNDLWVHHSHWAGNARKIKRPGHPAGVPSLRTLRISAGGRRDVPQFFNEWKLVKVPSFPLFSSREASEVIRKNTAMKKLAAQFNRAHCGLG